MSYYMANNPIPSVLKVRDLGVIIGPDLKFREHINAMCKKAGYLSASIYRTFVMRDRKFLVDMFKTYVRPILEYNSPVWSPFYICDIDKIESVQRSYTKRMPGMLDVTYPHRLELLGLESLEKRRLVNDLCEVFKMVFGLSDLNTLDFFEPVLRSNRGHEYKFIQPHVATNCKRMFFASRVVPVWNSLDTSVFSRSVGNVEKFRSQLRNTDFSNFLKGSGLRQ
jgi:hypothetical protein